MPRSSGQYTTPPSVFPFTPGTVISSADMNLVISDIAAEMTNSLPRDGTVPMSAQLKIVDGSITLPGINFNSDASTGMYRKAPSVIGFASNGADLLTLTNGTVAVPAALTVATTANVTGAVVLSSTLAVTGTTTLTGNVTMAGSLAVTGGLTITGTTTGVTKAMVGLDRVDNTNDLEKPVSTAVQALITQLKADRRGAIFAYGGGTAPAGSFVCNGQAVSRTTYAALFAIIGTAHGAGDGSTTFNVPDLRGEFLRGLDLGRGVDAGRVLGSTQAGQNLSHVHGVTDPTHAHSVYDPGHGHGGATDAQGSHNHDYTYASQQYTAQIAVGVGFATAAGTTQTSVAGNHAHNLSVYGAGTGIGIYGAGTGISIQANGGTETRPRNVAVLYCIWA
jgi:microcystin-dependent protein